MGNNIDIGKPLRIAFVANASWAIFNFRMNLVEEFLKRGFEVIIIAQFDNYSHHFLGKDNVRYIPLNGFSRESLNPITNLLLLFRLIQIYKREKPDVIFHFTIKLNIFGSIAAAINRIPSVPVVTGLGYTFLDGILIRWLVKLLYTVSFRFPKIVVFENPDDEKLFLKSGIIRPGQGRMVNGCGIDINHFHPDFESENVRTPEKGFAFLFIGRLLKDKGIIEFIEAAKKIRKGNTDIQCWVIGERDIHNPSALDEKTLLSSIDSGAIKYFGYHEDVRPFIKAADCIVLPSYREGLPKSLLEAMAMGKAIITTDVPGCRETLNDGENGIKVPARSSVKLLEAMLSFCKRSKDERALMGVKGRELALTRFCDTVVTHQYLDLVYEFVLANCSAEYHFKTPEATAVASK